MLRTLIAEVAAANKPVDSFGHKQLGGLAPYLAEYIQGKLGVTKVRGIELSLLQRCAAHVASQTDIDASYASGEAAVKFAIEGQTDYMAGFERSYDADGNYVCNIKLLPLDQVINTEKTVQWLDRR